MQDEEENNFLESSSPNFKSSVEEETKDSSMQNIYDFTVTKQKSNLIGDLEHPEERKKKRRVPLP